MSTRPPRVIKRLANSPEEAIARSAPVPAEMPPTHNLKKETVLPGVPEYPFLQEFRLYRLVHHRMRMELGLLNGRANRSRRIANDALH